MKFTKAIIIAALLGVCTVEGHRLNLVQRDDAGAGGDVKD